tara:strand:- start:255 stop:512 length:258 start_codon:yes stop_codon:yes gene_type:complete
LIAHFINVYSIITTSNTNTANISLLSSQIISDGKRNFDLDLGSLPQATDLPNTPLNLNQLRAGLGIGTGIGTQQPISTTTPYYYS